jgi:hypothetical protein
MKKVSSFLSAHSYRNAYIIIALLAASGYIVMRNLFIAEAAWGYVLTSQLTLNLVILFGLWGVWHNKVYQFKNPLLNQAKWFAGFIVIVLILRVYGMRTIFG